MAVTRRRHGTLPRGTEQLPGKFQGLAGQECCEGDVGRLLERGSGAHCQGCCDRDHPQGLSLPSSPAGPQPFLWGRQQLIQTHITRGSWSGPRLDVRPGGAGAPSLPLVSPRERLGGSGVAPPVTRTPGADPDRHFLPL